MKNEEYFQLLLQKYPHLTPLSCQDGYLYYENDAANLTDVNLASIGETYGQMQVQNYFVFIKYRLYNHNKEHYSNLVSTIIALLRKTELNDFEKKAITAFAEDFWYRSKLLLSENVFNNDEDYKAEYYERQKVRLASYQLTTPGAQIINETYESSLTNSMNSQNSSNKSNNKGLVLTRNNGLPSIIPDDQDYPLTGFSNSILIILLTIILGVVLALIFI